MAATQTLNPPTRKTKPYQRKIPVELGCGLDIVKEVLYGKWKMHLIHFIGNGIQRPGELQRKIPGATRRVLNMQLNQLEAHGIVSKKIFAELPPHVEYSLTSLGQSVQPLLCALGYWGDENQHVLRDLILQSGTKSETEYEASELPVDP